MFDDAPENKIANTFGQGCDEGFECFTVFWHGDPVGEFSFDRDGIIHWQGFLNDKYAEFLEIDEQTGVPIFLTNLLPENKVFELLDQMQQKDYIAKGIRFLSNLRIAPGRAKDLKHSFHQKQDDVLTAKLEDFTDSDGTFKGRYASSAVPQNLDQDTLSLFVAQYWKDRNLPRFSGAEIKIPVNLNPDGDVTLAGESKSFTHILKFPVKGHYAAWGVNEWMCMELSDAVGLQTAPHALIDIGVGNWPAYIVERFDIHDKDSVDNGRVFLAEQDFCTLCHLPPSEKFSGTLESVAKAVKSHSSDWEADREVLFKRILLSWLVGDVDMHRKNLAMMFEYNNETGETTAKMAPTYDVTSEIYRPGNMPLLMSGKTVINQKSALRFATQCLGMSREDAYDILEHMCQQAADRALEIQENPPKSAIDNDECMYAIDRIVNNVCDRVKTLGFTPPEFKRTPVQNAPKIGAVGIEERKGYVAFM